MRLAPVLSSAFVAVLFLPGCAVVDTAATVASAAVSVTATAVSVGGKVVGAGVDAVTPSHKDDHHDDDSDSSQ